MPPHMEVRVPRPPSREEVIEGGDVVNDCDGVPGKQLPAEVHRVDEAELVLAVVDGPPLHQSHQVGQAPDPDALRQGGLVLGVNRRKPHTCGRKGPTL